MGQRGDPGAEPVRDPEAGREGTSEKETGEWLQTEQSGGLAKGLRVSWGHKAA